MASQRGRYVELKWTPDHGGPRKAERSPRRYRAWIPAGVADYEPSLPAALAALCERAGADVRQLNNETAGLIALEGLGRLLLRSPGLAPPPIQGLRISHRQPPAAA